MADERAARTRRGPHGAPNGPTSAERRAAHAAVDDLAVVLDAAARFLETRPRSIGEVRRRLTSAGYRRDLVDGAIARLVDLGYLDDEAFARSWVESRDRAHPRGELALRRELALKGVDREVAARVLDERRSIATDVGGTDGATEDPDDLAARRLLERRARQIGMAEDPRVRRQRAYALLARNGFDPDVCRRVAAAWAAAGEPDEETKLEDA